MESNGGRCYIRNQIKQMDLRKIMAISGKPGLYRVVGQMKNGVVVEGLDDNKRFPAYATQQLSLLSEISIYTEAGDTPLTEIMGKIKDSLKGAEASLKGSDVLTQFSAAVPDYDADRVYVSDMKKVLKWYNGLVKANFFDAAEDQVADESPEDSSEEAE